MAQQMTQSTQACLWIGDLPPEMKLETLQMFLTKMNVEFSWLKIVPIKPRGRRPNAKGKAFAIVSFQTNELARKALEELNFATVNGQEIRVMFQEPEIKSTIKSGRGNIFIRNLHRDITQSQLWDAYSSFGNLASVKIVKNDKGESTGLAYVRFYNPGDAIKAIEATNDKYLMSQKIHVEPFVPKNARRENFVRVFLKNIPKEWCDITQEKDDDHKYPIYDSSKIIRLCEKFAGPVEAELEWAKPFVGEDPRPAEHNSNRLFAILSFKEHEHAVKAVEVLNDHAFQLTGEEFFEADLEADGQEGAGVLFVARHQTRAERAELRKKVLSERSFRLYKSGKNVKISNLKLHTGEEEKLKEVFIQFGDIETLRIKSREAGDSIGYVCFATIESAINAANTLNGKESSIAVDSQSLEVKQLRHTSNTTTHRRQGGHHGMSHTGPMPTGFPYPMAPQGFHGAIQMPFSNPMPHQQVPMAMPVEAAPMSAEMPAMPPAQVGPMTPEILELIKDIVPESEANYETVRSELASNFEKILKTSDIPSTDYIQEITQLKDAYLAMHGQETTE
eukprot:gnl/Dysnectes_brevis/248_a279_8051.p2 GENE.gnl/Dysnectes_brevis/248_a279_8051~~gnl/Dysnectes_brevis/248_a279_8051.p2  ORF type:complete len:562 (-),score=231.45 gnl/Dysnectes_brevis/248_a279_8051:69-1754(-)